MRYSNNELDQWGELLNGYDYENQAWVVNGFYVNCGHPETMSCGCFGRKFAGVSFSHLALGPVSNV
jgi:hypothetical protein